MALAFAFMTCCLFDHVLIIGTSFFGSYLLMKGIGAYAGGFPNEVTIYEDIVRGDPLPVKAEFYGYLVGFVVMALIGILVQYKLRSGESQNQRHPYHRYH